MLSRDRRMCRSTDFQRALRGRRAGRGTVVATLAAAEPDTADQPARVGFIVSRAVGGATTRNRVRRRLRHLVAAHLDQLPTGSLLVVRALPAAADAPRAALAADLDRVVRRLLLPATPRTRG